MNQNQKDVLNHLISMYSQNQLLSQYSTMATMYQYSDLLLHLKSRILMDLFNNAFKRYLQSVKPYIAQNITNAVQMNQMQPQQMMTPPRQLKIQRKNTDLMSNETIEESDAHQTRRQNEKVCFFNILFLLVLSHIINKSFYSLHLPKTKTKSPL